MLDAIPAGWPPLIYICTVHFQTEVWIEPQLDYLNRNIKRPFRVFACVPEHRRQRDFYLEVSFEPDSKMSYNHADKLHYLACLVGQEASRDDQLIFLDGDAFPIARLDKYVSKKLQDHRLIAIQRLENCGDIQPHPSFAATTVGFWQDIAGDWNPGYKWENEAGKMVTDTGGNMLKLLEDKGVEWYPMLRSNSHDLHPLWFGIYDGVVYHHGAGYRKPVSRVDRENSGKDHAGYAKSPDFERNRLVHEQILSEILSDRNFYKKLA